MLDATSRAHSTKATRQEVSKDNKGIRDISELEENEELLEASLKITCVSQRKEKTDHDKLEARQESFFQIKVQTLRKLQS